MLAISGLHIGLLASGVYIFLRSLYGLIPRLALYISSDIFALYGALSLATLYALLSGLSSSTIRAITMLILSALARFIPYPIGSMQKLWLGALVMMLFFSNLWFLPGTSLSFFAVFLN